MDQVLGEEAGAGGDRQFRMYVYLKPKAVDIPSSSREFFHDKDNTVYHNGFPICYRLKHGPPSIQFSITKDERMSDIDVDYRSATFPKALFDGRLTAGNSDVRAGGNLATHDNRWEGLNGWWRQVFGFTLGSSAKASKDATTGRAPTIPVNPRVTANQGIDASVHDFLKSWVVDRQPQNAVAYLSPLSYPCLETMARQKQEAIQAGHGAVPHLDCDESIRREPRQCYLRWKASTGKLWPFVSTTAVTPALHRSQPQPRRFMRPWPKQSPVIPMR
jgi:hypothetical protein